MDTAEMRHYVMLIGSIILMAKMNTKSKEENKSLIDENFHKVIPETKFTQEIDYVKILLFALPLLYLLKQSKTQYPLNYYIIIGSYVMLIKTIQTFLAYPHTNNSNKLFPLLSCCCMTLIYWNITNYKFAYFYLLLFALFELSRRDNKFIYMFNDLILVHSVFFFMK